MERDPAHRTPLLHNAVPDPARRNPDLPLRACLLSGGESRRMGRDKALLPHAEGGTWLERTLTLLGQLALPITLFSRHASHRQLAQAWAATTAAQLEALAEPAPWEGPLLALQRLSERYPNERLLLCPVDMPALDAGSVAALLAAAASDPTLIHLADDGERLQPLLAVVPTTAALRAGLAAAVAGGERRLQRWLLTQPHRAVRLDGAALRNCNRPGEISPEPTPPAGPAPAPAPA